MKKTQLLLIFGLLFTILIVNAIPPSPTAGYRLVLVEDYSDEFNGTELDATKWNNYHPHWQGRKPAKFVPEAISVKDGTMQIKNGIMDAPFDGWELTCGAVTSKKSDAYFGYYECSFKASLTTMSTTFWLANNKVDFKPGNCATDKYSLELDIAEAIGDAKTWPGFANSQKSNTHFRYVACGASQEKFYSNGASKSLGVRVADTFNTFAAWWHDENFVTFYANNKKGAKVKVNTQISDKPFDRPMFINMVTETYSWEVRPTDESLLDDTKNTSYYDWVRHYKEVPIEEEVMVEYPALYEESCMVEDILTFPLDSVAFTYEFKANEKRELNIKIVDTEGSAQKSWKLNALRGYGKNIIGVKLDTDLVKGDKYSYIIDIRPVDSTDEYIISSDTVELAKEVYTEVVELSKTPKEPSDTIRCKLDYTVDIERELNYKLTDADGKVKMSDKRIVARGIVEEDLKIGLDFEPEVDVKYTLTFDIRPVGGSESDIISSDFFEMKLEPESVSGVGYSNVLLLFPNPAKSNITIKGLLETTELNIYSQTGQLISTKLTDETGLVDINDLKSGIYFIRIEDQILKFVKN